MAVRRRGRRLAILLSVVVLAAAVVAVAVLLRKRAPGEEVSRVEAVASAPADLVKLRDEFTAGVDALGRGDGATAIRIFRNVSLGPREVEEYRLYYLATAYQLAGDEANARRTLARLWQTNPKLVYRNDVGFNIGSLYSAVGSWNEAGNVYAAMATRAKVSAIAAEARWNFIEARLYAGDPAGALFAARNLIVQNPRSPRAADAISLVRALLALPTTAPLPLTLPERIERAESLLRDGDAARAITELSQLKENTVGTPWRQRILLTRGLAYQQLRKFVDSDKALQPILTDQFRFAIPATRAAARNSAALSSSIDPFVYKTVTEKKRVGTVKVRNKKTKKLVSKPRYKTTKKQVKLVDLAKKLKKDEYDRNYVERLKDLLEMPIDRDTRKQTLTLLLTRAEQKNQDAYMRELIPELVKLDSLSDPGLQRFWDKGWAAYSRGDLKTARELLTFIRDTYTSPNIRRQSTYWLARIDERTGNKDAARRAYEELAEGSYEDIYARFAERRGAKRNRANRFKIDDAPDWIELADKGIPSELRLAHELLALGVIRDARIELQENSNDANRKWSDALLSQLFYQQGALHVAYRYMRRAFPELATMEQNKVPRQFIRMYYPLDWEDDIRKWSKQRALDPYLVMALIRQESAYDPKIKSSVGATGLMQIMPPTGRELGRKLNKPFAESRLTNPELNIELGTYYLRQLIGMVGGNTEQALAAYNGGIGNVWKWQKAFRGKAPDEFIESIPFSETKNYVKRITLMRSSYEQHHGELTR